MKGDFEAKEAELKARSDALRGAAKGHNEAAEV
jgi:hypothetical protein